MFVNVLLWKEEALELRDSADGFEFTIQDVLRSEHEIRHYDPLWRDVRSKWLSQSGPL